MADGMKIEVVGGKLGFTLSDGSRILCECIAEPYASQIVADFEQTLEEAYGWGANAAPRQA